MSHASQASQGFRARGLLRGGAASLLAMTALLVVPVAAQAAGSRPVVAPYAADSRFPVPVRLGNARQVITVQAHGSHATVTAWQLTRAGWQRVLTTAAARIGAHGLADGATRVQNTLTTPTGTYTLTQGFGNGPAPRGTRIPYHRVTANDWWVEDPRSRYYNTMRTAQQGGFPLTEAGARGSEHLANYPVQYHNALVIDFNMHPAVPGRGAGIFLHDLSTSAGPTAGCVAVPAAVMSRILQWINPSAHPIIAIGGV